MSNEIKRYRLKAESRYHDPKGNPLYVTEQLHKRGGWVRYKDVQKLEKELAELRVALTKIANQSDESVMWTDSGIRCRHIAKMALGLLPKAKQEQGK